ncbi:transcription factor like [Capsicum annuum]
MRIDRRSRISGKVKKLLALFPDADKTAQVEMASIHRLLHIPGESVPHKISTKRSYATHRLDIEERILNSKKNFKKMSWQPPSWKGVEKSKPPAVPSNEKNHNRWEAKEVTRSCAKHGQGQTSYADMLEIAVQHIQTLRDRVQRLNTEIDVRHQVNNSGMQNRRKHLAED